MQLDFLWVDEAMNGIIGLGEDIIDFVVVKKVLRTLPQWFDSKFSTIEEAKDLTKLTMEEFFGSLTSYEMRNEVQILHKRESTFKVVNKEEASDSHSDSEEEENFVRKLKKGLSKYKGKLQFKCFNCGRISHYTSKCPFG